MGEDVMQRLGESLAISYEKIMREPLSPELRDRVLELAIAEALADEVGLGKTIEAARLGFSSKTKSLRISQEFVAPQTSSTMS